MDNYTASEQVYKNGYEQGQLDALKEIFDDTKPDFHNIKKLSAVIVKYCVLLNDMETRIQNLQVKNQKLSSELYNLKKETVKVPRELCNNLLNEIKSNLPTGNQFYPSSRIIELVDNAINKVLEGN